MKKILIFLLGATTGSIVTWKLIEKKYKQIADEEIESVKKVFKEKQEKINNIGNDKNNFGVYKDIIEDLNTEDATKYEEISSDYKTAEDYLNVKSLEYPNAKEINVNLHASSEEENLEKPLDRSKPYVISPEEFGELFGYETKSWTYYADDVLVDENYQIVEDPKEFIGDALNHFGEYEEDSVFVRDEKRNIDYEILRVTEEYSNTL